MDAGHIEGMHLYMQMRFPKQCSTAGTDPQAVLVLVSLRNHRGCACPAFAASRAVAYHPRDRPPLCMYIRITRQASR